MNRLAIFVSGSGTNMESLIREMQAGRLQADPVLVVCDKPSAGAIDKAKQLGVEVALVNRKNFTSQDDFEQELARKIDAKQIDWICLAGFMRILSAGFVNRYWGKIINIHPSLLPKFPGAHGIRDAFESGEKETGVTVHFVIPAVDAGPVILQERIPIDSTDTLETLEEKVHTVEYQIYPKALKLVFTGEVKRPIRKL